MRAPSIAWFSLTAAPITRIKSASSISAMELVIAPEPQGKGAETLSLGHVAKGRRLLETFVRLGSV